MDKTKNPEMPPEYRPLLITSVLNCIPAKTLLDALDVGDEITAKHVLEWQKAIRDWLGLPQIGRRKPSADYQKAILEWLAANGDPTPEEIDQGWIPLHLRTENQRKLPPKYQEIMDETRQQIACLQAAETSEELRRMLKEYMNLMGRAHNDGDLSCDHTHLDLE